jgi:hypothetical protein
VITGDDKKVTRINATDAPCSIGTLKRIESSAAQGFSRRSTDDPRHCGDSTM